MVVIAVVGAAYFFIAKPSAKLGRHVHDAQEASGAERA
jgi:hypothetical protein